MSEASIDWRAKSTHLPALVLFLLLVFLSWDRQVPLVSADEFGYLSNARVFAGQDPILAETAASYTFGYSLAILPCFFLSDAPDTVYRAILLENCVLLTTTYYLLLALFVEFGLTGFVRATCFTACLSPAVLFRSRTAMSEPLFIPAFLLLFYLTCKLVRRPTNLKALGLAALTAFLYVTHQRTICMLVVVAGYLGWLAFRKRLSKSYTGLALGIMVVGTALSRATLSYLSSLDKGRSFANYLLELMGTDEFWERLAPVLFGQFWYVLISTCGLALFGFIWICQRIRGHSHRDALVLYLLNSASILAISVISTAVFVEQFSGWFVHGRYNEGYLVLLIALGLHSLNTLGDEIGVGTYAIFAAGTVWAMRALEPIAGDLSSIQDSPGYRPLQNHIDGPVAVTLFTVAVLGLALFCRRVTPSGGLVVFAIYFSTCTYLAVKTTHTEVPIKSLSNAVKMLDTKAINFEHGDSRFYDYQYLQYSLPDVSVSSYWPSRNEKPEPKGVLVSGYDTPNNGRRHHYSGPRMTVWLPPEYGPPRPWPGSNLLAARSVAKVSGLESRTWLTHRWAYRARGKVELEFAMPLAAVDTLVLDIVRCKGIRELAVEWNGKVLSKLDLKQSPGCVSVPLPKELRETTLVQLRLLPSPGQDPSHLELRSVHLSNSAPRTNKAEGPEKLLPNAVGWTLGGPYRCDLILNSRSAWPAGCHNKGSRFRVTLSGRQRASEVIPLPFEVKANTLNHFVLYLDPRTFRGQALAMGAYKVTVELERDDQTRVLLGTCEVSITGANPNRPSLAPPSKGIPVTPP